MSVLFPRLWFIAAIFTGLSGASRICFFAYKWKWPIHSQWWTLVSRYYVKNCKKFLVKLELHVVCFCHVLWVYMLQTL